MYNTYVIAFSAQYVLPVVYQYMSLTVVYNVYDPNCSVQVYLPSWSATPESTNSDGLIFCLESALVQHVHPHQPATIHADSGYSSIGHLDMP